MPDKAKLKVWVYHSMYGCETGCCGHTVEVEGKGEKFEFTHLYEVKATDEDRKKWARDLAEQVIQLNWPECLESIDWETMDISEISDD